jgi:hypothetical protein
MNLHFDPQNFKSTTLVLFLNFMIPYAQKKKKRKEKEMKRHLCREK